MSPETTKRALVLQHVGLGVPLVDIVGNDEVLAALTDDTFALDNEQLYRRNLTGEILFPFDEDWEPGGPLIASGEQDERTRNPNNQKGLFLVQLPINNAWWLQAGVWIDFYLARNEWSFTLPAGDGAWKYGYGYIVSVESDLFSGLASIRFRIIELTGAGKSDLLLRSTSAAPHTGSFIFPFLPRTSASTLPEDVAWLDSLPFSVPDGEEPLLRETILSPDLVEWTRQVGQNLDARGGFASTSGFSTTFAYEGREFEGSPRPPKKLPRSRTLETLVAQNAVALGSSSDAGLYDNPSLYFISESWIGDELARIYGHPRPTRAAQALAPLVTDDASLTTTALVAQHKNSTYEAYWGHHTTDFHYATNPKGEWGDLSGLGPDSLKLTALVVPSVYGSDVQPQLLSSLDKPSPWATPASWHSRKTLFWVIDVDNPNPWETAELVQTLWVDSWGWDSAATNVTVRYVDALAWVRSSRQTNNYRVVPTLSSANQTEEEWEWNVPANYRLFEGNIIDTLKRQTPYETAIRALFLNSENERNAKADANPQWIVVGGYAFPRVQLVHPVVDEEGGGFYWAPLAHREKLYCVTHTMDWSGRVPEDGVVPPAGYYSLSGDFLPDTARLDALKIRKVGIPLGGKQEEGFDISSHTINEGDWSLMFRDDFTLWNVGYRRLSRKEEICGQTIAMGYVELASNPALNQPLMNSNNKRPPFSDGVLPTGLRLLYSRLNSFAYSRFATEKLKNIDAPEMAHVFYRNPLMNEEGEVFDPIIAYQRFWNRNKAGRGWSRLGPNGAQTLQRSLTIDCFATLYDVVLQVLTSTGTYAFAGVRGTDDRSLFYNDSFGVKHGHNGAWDVLPKEFGLGLPLTHIDVEQLRSYKFAPALQVEFEELGLEDIILQNLWVLGSEDIVQWLENLLRGYGLALVFGQNGMLQVRTLDLFELAIPAQPLSLELVASSDSNSHPRIPVSSGVDTLLQRWTQLHDDGTVRWFSRRSGNVGTGTDFIRGTWNFGGMNLVVRDADVRLAAQTQTSGVGALRLYPTASSDGEATIPSTPLLLPESSAGYPAGHPLRATWLDLEVDQSLSPVTPLRLGYWRAALIHKVLREEKVLRWQRTINAFTLEVQPPYVGSSVTPELWEALTPGAQVRIALGNTVGADGSRDTIGILLLSSVRRDIESGTKQITGWLVAASEPVGAERGNYWALSLEALDQTGVPTGKLKTKWTLDLNLVNDESALKTNLKGLDKANLDLKIYELDEWGQILKGNTITDLDDSVDGEALLTLATNPDTDTAYVVLRELEDQSEGEQGNAWHDEGWFWRP